MLPALCREKQPRHRRTNHKEAQRTVQSDAQPRHQKRMDLFQLVSAPLSLRTIHPNCNHHCQAIVFIAPKSQVTRRRCLAGKQKAEHSFCYIPSKQLSLPNFLVILIYFSNKMSSSPSDIVNETKSTLDAQHRRGIAAAAPSPPRRSTLNLLKRAADKSSTSLRSLFSKQDSASSCTSSTDPDCLDETVCKFYKGSVKRPHDRPRADSFELLVSENPDVMNGSLCRPRKAFSIKQNKPAE